MTIDHIIDLVTWLVYNLQTRNRFLMTSAKMKIDVINQLLLSTGTTSESRNIIACLDPQKPLVIIFIHKNWSVNSVYTHINSYPYVVDFWFQNVFKQIQCINPNFHGNPSCHSGNLKKIYQGVYTPRLHKGLTVHPAWGGSCRDPYFPTSWK